VVATEESHPWSEGALLVSRLCGALACGAEVELLLAGPPNAAGDGHDGAVTVRRFDAPAVPERRRLAVRRALLGPQSAEATIDCGCVTGARRRLAGTLAPAAQSILIAAAGGDAAELFRRLRTVRYDLAVFVGYGSASTCAGVDAVEGRCPWALVPAATGDADLWNPAVGQILRAASRIVVTGEAEAATLAACAPGLRPGVVRDVGFVAQVNAMASRAPAYGFDGRPTVVVARDWSEPSGQHRLLEWCDALRRDLGPEAAVRLVGPGTQRLPRRLRAEAAASRTDVWRWMAHALVVLDAEPHRLLGREVLEAFLFGTPVVVAADGGATRSHAESGDGGLWFRSYAELLASVSALGDPALRAALGGQGRRYATERFGDTAAFIRRVDDAVLEVA
jgi:hypothetical protein